MPTLVRFRSFAVLCFGTTLSLGLSSCATANVTVVNDTSSTVRLSGCYIDDALDLDAGQRASEDIPAGRWGCDVYRYALEPLDYVGCLVIGSQDRTYRLARDVGSSITEKQCDRIR